MIGLLLFLAAGPPDTLRLSAGVHPGPLVISRPTVVLGSPGAVIRGSGTGSVVEIHAPGTTLRGLRIEHSGRDVDRDDAGILVRADSVLLEDLEIRDILFGIYLRKVRNVTLRRVDIEGPRGLPESQTGNGIHLHHSRNIVIADSRIAGVRDGIYFEYTDSAVVTGNRVSRMRFGLHYMFSHYNRFERNTFTHGAAGAVVMNSNGLVIRDNVFAWNGGSRSFGLILQTATEPSVERNVFVGNGVGTFFDNVIRGRYTGNLVAENWLGLQLFSNSEQTEVTGNAMVGNTFDVAGGATPGAYMLCAGRRGNYWSKAMLRGYDLDGDGVLDQPFGASSPLAELARAREGLRLFLGSPAARALDWAEQTFPVFSLDQAEDSCPAARPPRMDVLASLPAEGQPGEPATQYAAALGSMAAGLGLLIAPRWRRRATSQGRKQ
ncbi:MAG TPA: nitrous oxide reductase family maturation protein NosD [Gemmatimonadales bacterium]